MFFAPETFAFVQTLEAGWLQIREELEQLGSKHFLPWPERQLYGQGWDVFGLYFLGRRVEKNCALCPETARLLGSVPALTMAGFSSLVGGRHIQPHTGYTSAVLRCHLGLIVPPDCALRVGDETRSWEEGKCLVFDDTVEHEAWNRSDRTRVVLLLDFRRPPDLPPGK